MGKNTNFCFLGITENIWQLVSYSSFPLDGACVSGGHSPYYPLYSHTCSALLVHTDGYCQYTADFVATDLIENHDHEWLARRMLGTLSHSLAGTAMQTKTSRHQSPQCLGVDMGKGLVLWKICVPGVLHASLHVVFKAVFWDVSLTFHFSNIR